MVLTHFPELKRTVHDMDHKSLIQFLVQHKSKAGNKTWAEQLISVNQREWELSGLPEAKVQEYVGVVVSAKTKNKKQNKGELDLMLGSIMHDERDVTKQLAECEKQMSQLEQRGIESVMKNFPPRTSV